MEFFPRGFRILTLGLMVSASPLLKYMSSNCDSTINVYSSTRVKLNLWPSQNPCTVTFDGISSYHAFSNTHLSARFLSINLDHYNMLGQCLYQVDIIDSDGSMLTDKNGTCGSTVPVPNAYTSSRKHLQVEFKRPYSSTFGTGSFEILITRYSLGYCSESEYKCRTSSRCVSNTVTCDGYKDCPDNSDEVDACGLSTDSIVGIAIACLIAVIIFVIIIVVLYRRRTYGEVFESASVHYRRSDATSSVEIVAPPAYEDPPPYEETSLPQVLGVGPA